MVAYTTYIIPTCAVPPPTLNWKIDRICLDLFHFSSADRITGTYCYDFDPKRWGHTELIAAWADAVPLLPDDVRQVWLDVTPAPATKRKQHPLTLNRFVHDTRVSGAFFVQHVREVSALVGEIDRRYSGEVEVVLTGTVSERSDWFFTVVNETVGRELGFSGTILRGADVRFAQISEGVCHLTSKKKMGLGRRWGNKHPLKWLRDVIWSNNTVVLFAQLAHKDKEQEMALLDDVLEMARFRGEARNGKGKFVLPPTGKLRRKFQHLVAVDLDLKTVGVGDGDDRHVVVSLL